MTAEAEIDWDAPISEDDIRAYFDAKKVRIKCELCEATSWMIAPNQMVGGFNAFAAVCGNCGNIRMHTSAALRRWKAKGH